MLSLLRCFVLWTAFFVLTILVVATENGKSFISGPAGKEQLQAGGGA